MSRIVVLLVLTALAVGVAMMLQRRRPEPPSVPSYRAPQQVDRNDFAVAPELVMVAVFASDTCHSCAGVWETVQTLVGDGVGVQQILVQTEPDLHRRYRIDGVPTTVVAGPDGVVAKAFFGPVTAADLGAVLARRHGHDHHDHADHHDHHDHAHHDHAGGGHACEGQGACGGEGACGGQGACDATEDGTGRPGRADHGDGDHGDGDARDGGAAAGF